MSRHGFTLEEYMTFIRQYSPGSPLRWMKGSRPAEIFFIKADKQGTTEIELPEDSLYMVSGNNVDGFIVTIPLPAAGAPGDL